ncbi:MAG: hypothetical protein ABSG86_24685 [Thermoguttaceae bacterium]
MNYLAHALPFLDRPYFVAGTAVPDWLAVADRPVRVRAKHAAPLEHADDPRLAAVAGGVLQHLRDDRRFHETRAFAETALELAAVVRRALGEEDRCQVPGVRCQAAVGRALGEEDRCQVPGVRCQSAAGAATAGTIPFFFLGHLLVEVLLDAELAAEDTARLAAYERALAAVEPGVVQDAVNRMAVRPTVRLAPMIGLFCRERILRDYLEDAKLWVRLNQVLRRVGLDRLPDDAAAVLPIARQVVRSRRRELLAGIPAAPG